MIPGSDSWWSCSHANMHKCGKICCCDVGAEYDSKAGFCDVGRRLSSARMLDNSNITENDTNTTMLQVSTEAGPPIDGSEKWWKPCDWNENMQQCHEGCCCEDGYVY